jgi:UDP-N-acetylglucosamine pyrophosphorylase
MNNFIQKGNVVTIENGTQYLLTEDLEYEGVKYVYAVRIENEADITDDTIIFETTVDGENEYLTEVNDKDLYDTLLGQFAAKVADGLEKLLDQAEATE